MITAINRMLSNDTGATTVYRLEIIFLNLPVTKKSLNKDAEKSNRLKMYTPCSEKRTPFVFLLSTKTNSHNIDKGMIIQLIQQFSSIYQISLSQLNHL